MPHISSIKILGESNVLRIDKSAREILSRTGVIIPHEQMLKLFDQAGAQVDYHSGLTKIPTELIDECLKVAGKTFTIYGRNRENKAEFGFGKRNYNSIAGEAYWIDPDGIRRFATLNDVILAAKFGEILNNITIVGAMSDPHEIDIAYRCVEVVATLIRTTTKPITFWFHNGLSTKFIVEMLGAIAGGIDELRKYPITYPFLEPISPLRFATDGIDVLFETSVVPLPVSIGPMAQAGLTAPCTLAGTITQETAEILAGICLVQLIQPETPVCFGGIPHCFDMKTTQMIFAGPEQGLLAIAMTEMGKFYGLPVYINVGLTDSKSVDGQAGAEIANTLLLGMLAGADIFGHLGIVGVDQASSIDMLVFQNEIVNYLERIMRGFKLDEEHIALDIIHQVGPGGTFIDTEHTLEHFRNEFWIPTLFDRNYWQQWEQSGKKTSVDKIREHSAELIKTYKYIPLNSDTEKDIEIILRNARKHAER